MLGLLLIYWMGKYYYQLAKEYGRSKWGYAILGITIYYLGTFVFGFIFGLIAEIISQGYVDTMNESLFGLLMLPLGILVWYLFYKHLEKIWKKNKQDTIGMIAEIGKNES